MEKETSGIVGVQEMEWNHYWFPMFGQIHVCSLAKVPNGVGQKDCTFAARITPRGGLGRHGKHGMPQIYLEGGKPSKKV